MGCDIHTKLEINWGGDWEALDAAVFSDPYYSEDRPIGIWNTPYTPTPLRGRNYDLFALLADVRNASEGRPDHVPPLMQPRGVPDDASEEWKAYVERWGCDLHSTSYFTLAELLEFKKQGKLEVRMEEIGFVSLRQYIDYHFDGEPYDHWSRGVGNIDVLDLEEVKKRSREDLEALVTPGGVMFFGSPQVQDQWPRVLDLDGAFSELGRMMTEIEERVIGERSTFDPERIRLVFGFDN